MRAHNHQVRAYSDRARAIAAVHPGQDAMVGGAALGLAAVIVFSVLAVGWQVGGFVLRLLGAGA